MSTPTVPARTISIPVSAAWHAGIGIVLALIAITAFWVHFQLPEANPYKETATEIGLLAGFGALSYWLWCDLQRGRAERLDIDDAVAAAVAAAEAREARLLAVLQEMSEAVCANGTAVKELDGAVTENTGAIEALQDCYLEEGQAPPKEPGTRDFALAA